MENTKSWTGREVKVLGASVCLFLGMLTISSTAQSDEYKYSFKFTVPVQVQKLSVHATEIRIFCQVKDVNGNWLAEDFSGFSYSHNRVNIDSQGGFSGTLTYALKLKDPSEASKAKTYECAIQPGGNNAFHDFEDCGSDTAWICLKPGTPRTLKIQGTIP